MKSEAHFHVVHDRPITVKPDLTIPSAGAHMFSKNNEAVLRISIADLEDVSEATEHGHAVIWEVAHDDHCPLLPREEGEELPTRLETPASTEVSETPDISTERPPEIGKKKKPKKEKKPPTTGKKNNKVHKGPISAGVPAYAVPDPAVRAEVLYNYHCPLPG